MLSTLHALTLTAALTAPRVDVSTLDGRAVSGEFVNLSRTELVVRTDDGEVKLPVDELLEVVYPETEGTPTGAGPDPTKSRVILRDGTKLDATAVTVNSRAAVVETARVGKLELSSRAVASIRFPGADDRFEETWGELSGRGSREDLLVIRKTDVLDHLKGIIGNVDAEAVRFEIRNNEVPVALEKLYGVVFGGAATTGANKTACLAILHGADEVSLASIAWDRDAFVGKLAGGGDVVIPGDAVRTLDFSIGKVRYLSRVDPESVEYESYLPEAIPEVDTEWIRMRRDTAQADGDPIRIGKQTFERGLWLHSKTTVRYRLASEFRTFKAVMGMEYAAARRNKGNDVRVVIRGDDEVLLDTYVASDDDPSELNLDVTDVNFLEIVVDFGKDRLDTLDHLALGDARVLK